MNDNQSFLIDKDTIFPLINFY